MRVRCCSVLIDELLIVSAVQYSPFYSFQISLTVYRFEWIRMAFIRPVISHVHTWVISPIIFTWVFTCNNENKRQHVLWRRIGKSCTFLKHMPSSFCYKNFELELFGRRYSLFLLRSRKWWSLFVCFAFFGVLKKKNNNRTLAVDQARKSCRIFILNNVHNVTRYPWVGFSLSICQTIWQRVISLPKKKKTSARASFKRE